LPAPLFSLPSSCFNSLLRALCVLGVTNRFHQVPIPLVRRHIVHDITKSLAVRFSLDSAFCRSLLSFLSIHLLRHQELLRFCVFDFPIPFGDLPLLPGFPVLNPPPSRARSLIFLAQSSHIPASLFRGCPPHSPSPAARRAICHRRCRDTPSAST